MLREYTLVLIVLLLLSSCITKTKSEFIQEGINSTSHNFRSLPPAASSNPTPSLLRVKGEIPQWLHGKLLRNIPAKIGIEDDKITHEFDGLAFIASFEFVHGKVYYRSKFLESDQFIQTKREKKLSFSGFARTFGNRIADTHTSRDGQKVGTTNPNINIEEVGGHIIALGESPMPIEFDPNSIATMGFFDYADSLKKSNTWESAHLKRDPSTGDLYGLYVDYGQENAYIFYKIPHNKTGRKALARYVVGEPSYVHDFSITKDYIVLVAYPLVINPMDFFAHPDYSFIGRYRWKPELGTKIYVLNKNTGQLVCTLQTESMFAFHHINAFEESGVINLYLTAFESGNIVFDKKVNGGLYKLSINLSNHTVKTNHISSKIYEMPKIKDSLIGRPNTYFYAVWFRAKPGSDATGIVKYNIKTNEAQHYFNSNLKLGEPVFVPRPGSVSEDDGVLLSLGCYLDQSKSILLILDAKSFNEIAIAELPTLVPNGLHGKYLSRVK